MLLIYGAAVMVIGDRPDPLEHEAHSDDKRVSPQKQISHAAVERGFSMFKKMLLIRDFENAASRLVVEGVVPGVVHESTGQEAVAVGVCSNLSRLDLVQSNHRGHGHALAKGADPVAMMKEILGRVGGTCGGKGGSMHIADFSVGMMGANGILADGMSMAVGAAQAAVLKNEDQLVCVFVGEGTTNRGPFYESLNWAKVFNLPLLVVCEDNRYASSTLTQDVSAGGGPVVRARAFEIPAVTVDGNDLAAVDQAAAELVGRIRAGEGPQFLHAVTYRLKGHISRDPSSYRAKLEAEENWRLEPISRYERRLWENGISSHETDEARKEAEGIISSAVGQATEAPFPSPENAYEDVQNVGGPRCDK